MWRWLAAALVAKRRWVSPGREASVVWGVGGSRTRSCFHFQLSVGHGSSLGTTCLRVLDICFSALRIKYVLHPFLEKIVRKKAVNSQTRVLVYWFGFMYTAKSVEAHSLLSKEAAPTQTPFWKEEIIALGIFPLSFLYLHKATLLQSGYKQQ